MRSTSEMLELILNIAQADARVRAVVLNGSRANPTAPVDIFQDYDVVYWVTDLEPFLADLDWIHIFGDRIMMQLPDTMSEENIHRGNRFAWLMLFKDGVRIDLTMVDLNQVSPESISDSEAILLLDKDKLFPEFPPASDRDYWNKPPSEKQFYNCCNEFWWVSTYVAKGIWRDELPYAMKHFNHYVHDELAKMIAWYIGCKSDYQISSGKMGKYFKNFLEDELWYLFKKTYSDSDYDHLWNALFTACELFSIIAHGVSGKHSFLYAHTDEQNVLAYLRRVQLLSRDAHDFG